MAHPPPGLYYLLPVAYASTTIVTVGLAVYVLRAHRTKPTARLLGAVSACLAIWSVGMGGRLLSTTIDGTLAWNAIGYVGIVGTAIAWFLFALRYTGRDRYVTRPVVALLLVPAVLLVALVATSGHHSLYYAEMALVERWGHTVFVTDDTWVLYAATGWHYLLFLTGAALIVQFAAHSHRLYRLHSVVLSVGAVGPLLLNALYVFHVLRTGFDPTPFAFGVSVLLVAAAVFTADFIDVMPIARARVLDVIDEAVVVLDREQRILDYNARAAIVLSAAAEEPILGRPAADVLPEAVVSTGVLGDEFDEDAPTEIKLADDQWYLIRRRPVEASGGRIATIVVFVDITERKQHERTLEGRNQRLEEFASVVAHDLRNPLNAATGRLHLVAEEHTSDHLEALSASLTRMDRIIDDMLWLAREGRAVGERSPTRLPSLVQRAWANVGTGVATIAVDLREDLTVVADADRLLQVFENLFRNATEHGGVAVNVRVGLLPDGAGVFVEDDGPGIPESIRGRVFEGGYSTADAGTGLGLRIVSEIVDAHGWDVTATESIDGGARIELTGVEFVQQ